MGTPQNQKKSKDETEKLKLLFDLETHRHELEAQNEELRNSREETQAALNNYTELYDFSPIGLVSLNEKGQIIECNIAAADLLGHSRTHLTHMNISHFIKMKYLTTFKEFLQIILTTNTRHIFEVEFLIGNKTSIYCQVVGLSVSDSLTEKKQCRLAIMDISIQKKRQDEIQKLNTELKELNMNLAREIIERKQAEKKINENNQLLLKRTLKLTTAYQDLEAFSYSVAHDLRAPLRSINGFSHALLDDYYDTLGNDGKVFIDKIQESTNKMGDLIDDILKLFKISRSEIKNEKVNLTALAYDIMEKLRKTNPDRCITLHITKNLQVIGDRNLLESLLQNLLGNAWKFTSKTKNPVITFGKKTINGESVLFIKDNGAGFDQKYAEKIFLPFQRLHNEDEFTGSGVGLAIAQRIIKSHQGKIWAEGKIGKGATLYFLIPPMK